MPPPLTPFVTGTTVPSSFLNSLNIPTSYVVYQTGGTVYARSELFSGTDYSGTDAGAVLNSAITALGTSGGKIHIKAGTYTVSSTINLLTATPNQAIVIEGEGGGYNIDYTKQPANTVLYTPTDIQLMQVTGTGSLGSRMSGLVLKDFLAQGPFTLVANPNTTCNSTNDGIHITDADAAVLDRVSIRQFNRGIVLDGVCDAPTVIDCNIQNNNQGLVGLALTDFANISNCLFANNIQVEIVLSTPVVAKIVDCMIFGGPSTTCVQLINCSKVLVSGCYIYHGTQVGINSYSTGGNRSLGLTVVGNTFGYCTTTTGTAGANKSACIDLGPSSYTTITGNTFYDDQVTPTTQYALFEDTLASTDHTLFANNTLYQMVQAIPVVINSNSSRAVNNIGYNPQGWGATSPSVPATGVDQTNTSAYPVLVYLTGLGSGVTAVGITDPAGTLTSFTRTGEIGDFYQIDPNGKIRLTYTGSPTWKWYGV